MLRVLVTPMILGACAAQPAPSPAEPIPWHAETSTERNFFNQLPRPRDTRPGTPISGRVLLNGEPVTFFGVTTTSDANFTAGLGTFFRPTPFHTSDGRFTVTPRNAPNRDLIIAGPGFERLVLRAVPPKQDDVGDINVSTGHRIEGVVRDDLGHPVPNATVTFIPSTSASAREHLDQLTDLLLNIITVNSDEHGHYAIQGAAADEPGLAQLVDGPMRVIAQSPGRASTPAVIGDFDSTVDLTLHETGALELVAPGRRQHQIIIVDVRPAATPEVAQRFALDDRHTHARAELAAGDYDVAVHGIKQRVSITALGTTKVVAE